MMDSRHPIKRVAIDGRTVAQTSHDTDARDAISCFHIEARDVVASAQVCPSISNQVRPLTEGAGAYLGRMSDHFLPHSLNRAIGTKCRRK